MLGHGIGEVTFPVAASQSWKAVLDQKGDLVDHFSGKIGGVTVQYYRGGQHGQGWEKSPVLDDVALDTHGFDPARVHIAARILDVFRPVALPRASDAASLVDAQRAIQESTFARLERQLELLFEQTVTVRKQLDEAVRSKELQLDEAFRAQQAKAEEELERRRAALSKEAEALETRRKELDDSDNTFARRQIRDRMLSDVSDRVQNFGVSKATLESRRPVATGMIALAGFLVMLLAWTILELATATTTTDERIALWIRLSLLSLGFVASLVYYIKWQNQWATLFSATEQALKQFHIDVNRANWVVETCLEWRKETQSDIPPSLIESLTRGLFTDPDQAPQVLHPADELASALMGSASKVSLNVGENTIEFAKPSKIPRTVTTNPG